MQCSEEVVGKKRGGYCDRDGAVVRGTELKEGETGAGPLKAKYLIDPSRSDCTGTIKVGEIIGVGRFWGQTQARGFVAPSLPTTTDARDGFPPP